MHGGGSATQYRRSCTCTGRCRFRAGTVAYGLLSVTGNDEWALLYLSAKFWMDGKSGTQKAKVSAS